MMYGFDLCSKAVGNNTRRETTVEAESMAEAIDLAEAEYLGYAVNRGRALVATDPERGRAFTLRELIQQ